MFRAVKETSALRHGEKRRVQPESGRKSGLVSDFSNAKIEILKTW